MCQRHGNRVGSTESTGGKLGLFRRMRISLSHGKDSLIKEHMSGVIYFSAKEIKTQISILG
jgi:hypothetical protein